MEFKLVNNHILVIVETRCGAQRCVFDTGAPVSFLFDDSVKEFTFDGSVYYTSSNPMTKMLSFYRPAIEEMIGEKIDGFIGTDCLRNRNVLLNFPDRQLTVSTEPIDEAFDVPMSSMYGLPTFEMTVNGRVLRAAYDSGAMYSFVVSSLVSDLGLTPQNKTYADYNPMLGNFTADLFEGDIQIGASNLGCCNIASSVSYDQSLRMTGIEAFLGTDSLQQSIVGLSYIESRMGVKV